MPRHSGGAVTTNRSDAPNLKEPLWFLFARITGRRTLDSEWAWLGWPDRKPPKVCLTGFPTGFLLSLLRVTQIVCALEIGRLLLESPLLIAVWPQYLCLSRRHYGCMSSILKQHKSPCIPLMTAAKAQNPLNQAKPKATCGQSRPVGKAWSLLV